MGERWKVNAAGDNWSARPCAGLSADKMRSASDDQKTEPCCYTVSTVSEVRARVQEREVPYLAVARDSHDLAEVDPRVLHLADDEVHGLEPHFNWGRDFALVRTFDRTVCGAIVGELSIKVDSRFVCYLTILCYEDGLETLGRKVKTQEEGTGLLRVGHLGEGVGEGVGN